MPLDLPVQGIMPADQAIGDDQQDTVLIRRMGQDAADYCSSFAWCNSVSSVYFAGGVGGILCVFLLSIVPSRTDIGEWIWIVVGDIPPAYLPLEDADSAREVFTIYLCGMKNWVSLVRGDREGTAAGDVPPIAMAATPDNANWLEDRLRTLETLLTPYFTGKQSIQ